MRHRPGQRRRHKQPQPHPKPSEPPETKQPLKDLPVAPGGMLVFAYVGSRAMPAWNPRLAPTNPSVNGATIRRVAHGPMASSRADTLERRPWMMPAPIMARGKPGVRTRACEATRMLLAVGATAVKSHTIFPLVSNSSFGSSSYTVRQSCCEFLLKWSMASSRPAWNSGCVLTRDRNSDHPKE